MTKGGHTRSIEEIQDACLFTFGNERVIESIFVNHGSAFARRRSRSNIRPKALSQSVEPDALLIQGFSSVCWRDTESRAHVREGFDRPEHPIANQLLRPLQS